MSEIALAAGAPHRSSTFKVLAAASIGNALEWYDILAYGYFAVTISKLFFPTADPTTALLLTFGTFGVSYLVRPLGALVLGGHAAVDRHHDDRNGLDGDHADLRDNRDCSANCCAHCATIARLCGSR